MKITKITYKWNIKEISDKKALVICDIKLENKIILADVRLYKKDSGYFLVFPSKQDVYQTIQSLNPDVELNLPSPENGSGEKRKHEEFFFPVDSGFYRELLDTVVEGLSTLGYISIKKSGCMSFYPKKRKGCSDVKKEGNNL